MTALAKPRPLTEAAIQRSLQQLVKRLGGESYHSLYAVGSDPGYPDLTVWLPGGVVVWLECKGPKGEVKPAQVAWLERLGRSGWVVWPTAEKAAWAAGRWPSIEHQTYNRTISVLTKAAGR